MSSPLHFNPLTSVEDKADETETKQCKFSAAQRTRIEMENESITMINVEYVLDNNNLVYSSSGFLPLSADSAFLFSYRYPSCEINNITRVG
jgi:hypothetical protein